VGDYNNLETSYLYSPCFDISSLSNPMLSFSLAYSFEDCRRFNVVCDAGWMEYSLDGGQNWVKLGAFGEGESWYDYESGQVWMQNNQTDWREAIIPLPKHNGVIRLRYVMSSDDGSTREGLAIDNFHIYNGGPLPLQWISFDARLNTANKVVLQWRAANPRPSETFEVQYSRLENNQASFTPAGTLTAREGNGGLYEFLHNPANKQGQLFYRIVWTRLNGEKTISGVRKVNFPGTAPSWLLFPNPVDHVLYVSGNTENDRPVRLRILSSEGQLLYQEQLLPAGGSLNARIDISPLRLPAGVYFLEIADDRGPKVIKWLKK
jgi:hypothetical protein